MRVGSTFSGVGGLDLGLERAGMRVLWQAEVDEWCRRVLRWHWPDCQIYDDVRAVGIYGNGSAGRRLGTSLNADEQGNSAASRYNAPAASVDLLTGGFPCQDLSVAGKRRGLAGERSGLFFEFARIADELRPSWLLVENVVGLLSSANGRDMGVVLSTLAEIGYGLSWRVVDARYFGVPQRRRRVFIVGRLGDDGSAAVRALGAGGEGDLEAGKCSWQEVASRTQPGTYIAGPLTRRYGKGVNTTMDDGAMVVSSAFYSTGGSQTGFARTDDCSPTLKVGSGQGIASPPAVSFSENQRGELRESDVAMSMGTGGGKPGKGYAAVRIDTLGQDVSKPLASNTGGFRTTDVENGAYVSQAVRRLTPTECERLMSWPDGWTAVDGDKTPDNRRYAACGNGVVSNVSEWIGRRIVAVEREG